MKYGIIFFYPLKRGGTYPQFIGQCLVELVTVQKINNDLEQTIFGIVSNGNFW
ncbi:MAG: hypothetical protein F6K39_28275 [Okeania sp. SIO3B3]|nr:hypothetical protein [Okeania sp. SIO3B3]